MFRIRRIVDDSLPANRAAIEQVQAILRARFPALAEAEIAALGEHLRDPFKHRLRADLLVAEDGRHRVLGFAFAVHEPELRFAFLDYLASARGLGGHGVGGALYQRVREEALARGDLGLFLECLPDDPALCDQPATVLAQNRARLRFYERFGARPIAGTDYETPISPRDSCPPHLLFDPLDRSQPLARAFARRAVRTLLERKYGEICPPGYARRVVGSLRDDPVRLRPPRFAAAPEEVRRAAARSGSPIPLVVNDRHQIHHVRERGYVEAPVRIGAILAALEPTGLFRRVEPRSFPLRHLTAVHDPSLVSYLRRASADVPEGKSLYPYVFPLRNQARRPRERSVLAGYFCIDTFTPIHRNVFRAARRAADCALTAAHEVLGGERLAYALVRPPGHHAERSSFGGFCYFNSAAAAAQYLAAHGRVAMLDIDYHHGNGQQDIFYERSDVLTVSIHGHPRFAYPYFSGFADERGEGPGEGFNLNLPLPERCDGRRYRRALERALAAVRTFRPIFLVVALGLDPAKGDPTGTWSLVAADFRDNGSAVAGLGLPTLVVQEGGYLTRRLGANARAFFTGLLAGGLRT